MGHNVEKTADGLLACMHLSRGQAAVLLDQTSEPETLRVFIFDERASKRTFDIKHWRGYNVDIVCNAKFEPHGQVIG